MSLIIDIICEKHDLDVDHLHGTLVILYSGQVGVLTKSAVHRLKSGIL